MKNFSVCDYKIKERNWDDRLMNVTVIEVVMEIVKCFEKHLNFERIRMF
jgi:hypothetical protein